jgi:hypothetical protein
MVIGREQLPGELVHRGGDRLHYFVRADERFVGQAGHSLPVGGTKMHEEGAGDLHAVVFVAKDHLPPIGWVGVAADVPSDDHAIYQVRNPGMRKSNPLLELSSAKHCARTLADHDVQQRVKFVSAESVHLCEYSPDLIRLGRQGSQVSRNQRLNRVSVALAPGLLVLSQRPTSSGVGVARATNRASGVPVGYSIEALNM